MREAPRLLAGLFDDGGDAFLAEAGLQAPWERALAPVPVAALAVEPGPEAGWRQLAALRDLWSARGELEPALAATRALHQRRLSIVGRDHADTWLEVAALGALLQRCGRVEEGAGLLDQAWAALRSLAGGRDLRLAVVAQNVAAVRVRQGRLDDAEHALQVAHRIRKERAPHTTSLVAAQLGEVKLRLGRPSEAVQLLKEALEATVKAEGPGSARSLARGHMLGAVYNQLERYADAVSTLRPVYTALAGGDPAGPRPDGAREGGGPRPDGLRGSEIRASVAFELGLALVRTGAREEGLRRVEEALRLTRALGGDGGRDHPSLANRVTLMARLHIERGRLDEAEGLLHEAIEIDRRAFGDASAEVALRYAGLGQFLARHGRPDEAIGWMDPACSLLRSTAGDADPRTRPVVEATVALLLDQATSAVDRRDRELAVELVRRGTSLAEATLGPGHAQTRRLRDLRLKHRLG